MITIPLYVLANLPSNDVFPSLATCYIIIAVLINRWYFFFHSTVVSTTPILYLMQELTTIFILSSLSMVNSGTACSSTISSCYYLDTFKEGVSRPLQMIRFCFQTFTTLFAAVPLSCFFP